MSIISETPAADWLLTPDLVPDTDGVLEPFYAAAARRALAVPFCADCGQARELDQQVCDRCLSVTVEWREVALAGTVHAATLVHRLEPGLVVAERPYPVLDIELASGHRLVMTTASPLEQLPPIGAGVTIGFRVVGPVGPVGVVDPAGTTGSVDRRVAVPAAVVFTGSETAPDTAAAATSAAPDVVQNNEVVSSAPGGSS